MRNTFPAGRLLLLIFLVCVVVALAFGRFPLGGPVNAWLQDRAVSLGLDLRGGFHLEYEIDLSKVEPEAHEDALNAVQAVIERRVNAFGVGEPVVQIARRGADRFLIVELPGIDDIEQAKNIIKETPALEFREERTQEEITAHFEPLNVETRADADATLARIVAGEDFTAVQQEVDPLAALRLQQETADEEGEDAAPQIQYAAKGELAGAPAIEAVLFDDAIAANTVHSEIVESEVAYHIIRKADTRQVTPDEGEEAVQEVGYELITFIKQSVRTNPAESYKATDLTGEFLKRAEVTYGHLGASRPEVSIFFNPEGADMFRALTKRSIGKTIAIAVDDQIVSAPSVAQELPGGQAQITGNFSIDEASALASRLNEGALPVPIELASQQSVEASLGAEALAVSLKAGLAGLIAVMLYMIFYYRLLGLVAAFAIAFYTAAIIAILKLSSTFPAGLSITLTLSGIAGLILSIGMAVDANILIYERIREEVRRGRRFGHALEEGFKRAWSAIRDGNISTIITCLILMIIGTGFVKGFAIILIMGVIVSLFTAVVLVRMMLRMSSRGIFEKYPALIGSKLAQGTQTKIYQIIDKRNVTYVLSGVMMAVSLGTLAFLGLKPGIDFTGGTLMEVRTTEGTELSKESVCAQLPANFCAESFTVQKSEEDRYIIRYKFSTEERNTEVREALTAIDSGAQELRTDFVGSKISQQLKGNAITAILLVVAMILAYIAYAFRKISFPISSWTYGFTAVVALVHDIVIVLGLFAIFGKLFDVEVGIPFIAALLTILGYSVNDTIVVYDRVRENILRTKNIGQFIALLNQSISETLARSINTSLTVVVVLVAMILWGSASLVWFSVALLIGVIAGTYSSIFVATALVATIYTYKKRKGLLK